MYRRIALAALVVLASCEGPTAPPGADEAPISPPGSDSGAFEVTQFLVYPNGSSAVQGVVDNDARTLTAALPYSANLADVYPVITHNGTAISPPDDQFSDMSQPVVYTITAVDGTQHQYTANVTKQAAPKNITGFRFNGLEGAVGVINDAQSTIAVVVPQDTDRDGLVPTVTISGTTVTPASGVAQDFTQPVTYTVRGADNLERQYTVTVTEDPLSNSKDITGLTFANGSTHYLVVILGNEIFVAGMAGANISALIPQFTHTGVSINPPSGQARNFTNPVAYTVTAENGTTQTYTVTVEE